MDKIGRDGRGDPGKRPWDKTPNDSRTLARQLTVNQGLSPGDGPEFEPDDGFTTSTPPTPTLAEMTTDRGEHPPIGDVGKPVMPTHSRSAGRKASR